MYDTLYRKDNNGNINFWRVIVNPPSTGRTKDSITIEHGRLDGKIITDLVYCNRHPENSCIISLMDNDDTGRSEADFLKLFYNIPPVFIPKRFKSKDFADFVKNNKDIDINNAIKTFLTYYDTNKRNKLFRQLQTDNVIPF